MTSRRAAPCATRLTNPWSALTWSISATVPMPKRCSPPPTSWPRSIKTTPNLVALALTRSDNMIRYRSSKTRSRKGIYGNSTLPRGNIGSTAMGEDNHACTTESAVGYPEHSAVSACDTPEHSADFGEVRLHRATAASSDPAARWTSEGANAFVLKAREASKRHKRARSRERRTQSTRPTAALQSIVKQAASDGVGKEATLPGQDDSIGAALNQVAGDEVGQARPFADAEQRRVESFCQAQLQQDALGVLLGGGQMLAGLRRGDTGGQPARICHRVLHVPPPHSAHVTVRTWTHSPPVATAPVGQVMPAVRRAGLGPVAQLVPLEAGPTESLVRQQVFVSDLVIVGRRKFAAADPARQAGAVFDDQGVRAQVIRVRRDRGFQAGAPVVERFSGGPVDKVQADLREARRPRLLHRLLWPAGRVDAIEHR